MMPAYRSIQSVDFEYISNPGGNPTPVCMVAHDLISGKILRVWLHRDEEGEITPSCPISVGYDTLYLTFSAGAEVSCHITLGWPIPERLVDTLAEFRVITNGIPGLENPNILTACKFFGVGTSTTEEYKKMMRDRILAGPPYSAAERKEIMDYCQEDVRIQSELYLKMRDYLDGDRTLLRGEYMKVMTKMQYRGIPLDTEVLALMEKHLETLQQRMIHEVDADFNCYSGKTFKLDRFEDYLVKHGILTWPRTPSGRLSLEDGVFRDAVLLHKELQPLRDLRYLIGTLKLNSLVVGPDGRNRAYLHPFGAKTGRCTPSSAEHIFGPAVWFRSLIKPGPGKAILYIDYCQQEFGIGAFLSGDRNMISAYKTGDPYMAFAIQAGAAPKGATKKTHGAIRDLYKTCVLALQYGAGAQTLAGRLGTTVVNARYLISQHHRVYNQYWAWSDAVLDTALLSKKISTRLGWRLRVHPSICSKKRRDGRITEAGRINERSIRNWSLQSTGADMLRVALVFLDREDLSVIGAVHDATLVECDIDDVKDVTQRAITAMEDASTVTLGKGARIFAECEQSIVYPDRYRDKRDKDVGTFDKVLRILNEIEEGAV
jgi:hypothetical protein